MIGPVRVVALITTHPGRGAEQRAAFETLAPVVRAEDGCLQYELHAVLGDPDRFVVIERWASSDALSAHAASEHMRASGRVASAFRAGPAEILVLSDEPVV
jgi:quinol monooxygenase YgiN